VRIDRVGDHTLAEAAELFDAYRVHYGAGAAPVAAMTWLADQIRSERLLAWLASDVGAIGVVTVAPVPASIGLGTNWSIRDLYVRPAARGRGSASLLLRRVIDEAASAGVRRLALQTETDNPAISLYRRMGFEPVDGYVGLSRPVAG
jgi:GNAT superfamily N-acetyltransferase